MSECEDLKLGQLVISKMGRDRGRLCIVVRRLDDCAVLIADGAAHKFARPKRKNVKHLIKLDNVDETLSERLGAGAEVTDGDIAKALAAYRANG